MGYRKPSKPIEYKTYVGHRKPSKPIEYKKYVGHRKPSKPIEYDDSYNDFNDFYYDDSND